MRITLEFRISAGCGGRTAITPLLPTEMAEVETKPVVEGDASLEKKRVPKETFEPPPLLRAVTTYVGYIILYAVSLVGDFLRRLGFITSGHVEVIRKEVKLCPNYSLCSLKAVLCVQDWFKMNRDFESFFARNMYRRIRDCWNRPIGSTPGAYTDLVDRVSDDYNWTFRCASSPIHASFMS